MGLTTFAISNVLFSLATRDERRSVFSLEVLEDRMFLLCTAGSAAAILFGPELGIFQRILHTVHLSLHQWLICIVVAFAIVPVSEGRRLLLQRRGSGTARPASSWRTRLRQPHRHDGRRPRARAPTGRRPRSPTLTDAILPVVVLIG